MVTNLAEKYTGTVADNYEKDRTKSWKWKFEHKCLHGLLSSRIDIQTLVDIPCGTGRFHQLYKSLNIDAVGVDISADMLHQADQRGMSIQERDLFTFPVEIQYDAVVCFRFLNWVNMEDLKAAVSTLTALSKRYVFMTISTANPPKVTRGGRQFFPTMDQLENVLADIDVVDIISKDAGNGIVTNIFAGEVRAK